MKRDRYVGYGARGNGILQTRSVRLEGKHLFINADARRGEIRVQLLSAEGKPLKGFTAQDCKPLNGDMVDAKVVWPSADSLPQASVQVEFHLRDASVFAFESR